MDDPSTTRGTAMAIGAAAGIPLGVARDYSLTHKITPRGFILGGLVGAGMGFLYNEFKKRDANMSKMAEYYVKLAKKDMPSFTSQDRPKKVKEIYRALKRDHPEYSAGKKARIANAKGQ